MVRKNQLAICLRIVCRMWNFATIVSSLIMIVQFHCLQVMLVGDIKGQKVQDVKKKVQKQMVDNVSGFL